LQTIKVEVCPRVAKQSGGDLISLLLDHYHPPKPWKILMKLLPGARSARFIGGNARLAEERSLC
jgi:hypothetical protein